MHAGLSPSVHESSSAHQLLHSGNGGGECTTGGVQSAGGLRVAVATEKSHGRTAEHAKFSQPAIVQLSSNVSEEEMSKPSGSPEQGPSTAAAEGSADTASQSAHSERLGV